MPNTSVNLFIIFVVTGLILIGAELYTPGAILGTIGGIALFAAVITGYVAFGVIGGTYALIGIVIVAVITIIIWMKYFPASRIGMKIIVGKDLSTSKSASDYSELLGKDGETASELRPAGFATINGKRIDVVTQGEMIEKGIKITVIKIDGSRVVVEAAK
ncbi:MAG: NfeD family protein [Kiritimatiellae bacterium]|nr:NfeD family protein [Kiritimatiellia bacterium]MDD5521211.1 NfeD family protein [Kiritimatiellia bacterium]